MKKKKEKKMGEWLLNSFCDFQNNQVSIEN